MNEVDRNLIEETYHRLKREAEAAGYYLNPDQEMTKGLIEGLLVNQERYGYMACPCRLPSGEHASDLDIICPCDYRDPDLSDHGACYCALYVSREIVNGEKQPSYIPERRPSGGMGDIEQHEEDLEPVTFKGLPFPVWRCKVCGYLCARPAPPNVCPICKVSADRFERFI